MDTPKIVTGAPLFGMDVVRPGMLYATYLKGPVAQAKVASADLDAARAVKGVRKAFLIEGDPGAMKIPYSKFYSVGLFPGVAVVADSYWAARKGGNRLNVKWQDHPTAKQSSETFAKAAAAAHAGKGQSTPVNVGDFDAAFGAGMWAIDGITLKLTATPPGNAIFNGNGAGPGGTNVNFAGQLCGV